MEPGNRYHHPVGQPVARLDFITREPVETGVVTGWFYTRDDDGAQLIGEPYKVYRVNLEPGDGYWVHRDTVVDRERVRQVLDYAERGVVLVVGNPLH